MASDYLAKYHVGAQQADSLLAPVRADLNALTQRLQHYLDRVKLGGDAEAETLRQAHAALVTARDEIDRLWQSSAKSSRETAKKG